MRIGVVIIVAMVVVGGACQRTTTTNTTVVQNQNSALNANVTIVTDCFPSVALTEGPYYKAGAPTQTNIRTGASGTPLTLTGRVLNTNCEPIVGATLDFWQADGNGDYDTTGYRLRGQQATNANGDYTLETVTPGLYTGRTEHIHVKVGRPGGAVLTTQLFFPGVNENDSDSIYDNSMLIMLSADGATGTFNFVIE